MCLDIPRPCGLFAGSERHKSLLTIASASKRCSRITFGWRNLSNCFTDARNNSVTVSFRFGLCSFSAQRFSKRNTEHSCEITSFYHFFICSLSLLQWNCFQQLPRARRELMQKGGWIVEFFFFRHYDEATQTHTHKAYDFFLLKLEFISVEWSEQNGNCNERWHSTESIKWLTDSLVVSQGWRDQEKALRRS